jgi:predicted phage terminase large subunit-like protein
MTTPSQAKAEIARRELARRDPDAFIEYVMGWKQAPMHKRIQAHFSAGPRQGCEAPRDHGKTGQGVLRLAYDIGKDVNTRAKIVCESDNVALGRAKMLREILEKPEYRNVFPNVKPGRSWGDGQFTVERTITSPDDTVQAYGVRSSVIGGRADRILFDDVVGPEAIRSSAYRKNTAEKMDNAWILLLEPDAKAYYIATPWHSSDYTTTLRKRGQWNWMRLPIVDFAPVWPDKWGSERLRRQREEIGSIAYARAYELQPLSDEDTPIKPEWFRYYVPDEVNPAGVYRFLGVDLAISQKSGADYTAFVDIGLNAFTGRKYVMRTLRRRMDFPAALQAYADWTAQVKYRGVGIETVAFQRAFAQAVVKREGTTILEYPSVESKAERAAALSLPIERGEIYLLGKDGVVHPSQQELFDECTLFPAYEHKDMLDALGYAVAASQTIKCGPAGASVTLADDEDFVGKRESLEYEP